MAPPDDDGGTKYGGGPPKRPPLRPPATESAPRTSSGDTHVGGGPPKRPLAPPDDDGGETMFIDAAPQRAAFSRKRMQPPGHSGAIYLDRDSYRLGRAEGSDIPLYSPTASRQHATLLRDAAGWRLEPAAGKVVLADGDLVQESVRLQHEMRLQLGGDELIFSDETATQTPEAPDVAAAIARAAAQQRSGRGRWWWLAPLLVLLAAAFAAVLWWQTHAPVPAQP